MSSSNNASSSELDERVLAKAALDAAEEQLQSLCASHAGTFVSVERRARAMQEGLEDLLETASQVETKLKRAQEALEHEENSDATSSSSKNKQNTSTIAVLSEKHRVRRRTLLQHSSLLELLELPSLMDACVRSNLYEEALSIAAFANTLERRHYNKNTNDYSAGASGDGDNAHQHHQQQVVVVARVIEQIRSRQTDLRRHLLHRLKQTVTMPECLEVVTALRRLNSIDLEHRQQSSNSVGSASAGRGGVDLERAHAAMELRLQVDFLEARDIWLETISSAVASTTNPTSSSSSTRDSFKGTSTATASAAVIEEDLLDTIERYRTRVFEVATQFNAIFRAQQASSTASPSSSATDTDSVALLLSMWTSRRVHAFLTLLQSAQTSPTAVGSSSLPVGSSHSASSQGNAGGGAASGGAMLLPDASSLRDALEASVFFASSMGRLGADFTAQLPAIFEPRMHDIVVAYWKDGARSLQETLKVCREAGVATPLLQTNKMESSASSTTTAGASNASILKMNWTFSEDTVGVEGPQASAPRQVLMAMPPLARLVNAVLQGLNELRRCLLPGIFLRLRASLQAILQDDVLSTILTQNQRAVMVPGLRGDAAGLRNAATLYKQAMTDVVIPYCLGSLEAALGNHDGAVEYYTTVQENMKVPEPVVEEKEEEEQEEEKTEQVEQGAGDGGSGDATDGGVHATDSSAEATAGGDAHRAETQQDDQEVQPGPPVPVSKDD